MADQRIQLRRAERSGKRRHLAKPGLIIAGLADTMLQRGFDRLQVAAP